MKPWRQLIEHRRWEERSLNRLSLHESSHALAVHLLGGEVQWLRVGRGVLRDSLELDGGCHWKMRGGEEIPPTVRLIVSLSGAAADTFFFNRAPDFHDGDHVDAHNAAAEIAAETGVAVKVIRERAERHALALVIRHEAAIRELADRLRQARFELDDKAVARILRESGVKPGGAEAGILSGRNRTVDGYLTEKTPGRPTRTAARAIPLGFERRNGQVRAVAYPDPQRATAIYMRRMDGFIR